jgi:hypothetical protein
MIVLQLSPHTDHIDADGNEFTQRPYPFYVDADGNIAGRRDDVHAIGFQNDAAVQQVDLWWSDYTAGELEVAVGKYLVTQGPDGKFSTHVCAIESVKVI